MRGIKGNESEKKKRRGMRECASGKKMKGENRREKRKIRKKGKEKKLNKGKFICWN